MNIKDLLIKPQFPRSSHYEPDWVLDNQMGPHALWLLEWLEGRLPLQAGMRVLDLGCGKAMTSIYMAKEFGARVWAADLWIGPDKNWQRAAKAGVGDMVCPLRVEAHSLPFAKGFFDAIVSIDAYAYFGTDILYLDYLAGFLRPGGLLGVVVPGLMQEFEGGPPEHLTAPQKNGKRFWEDGCRSFKTGDWWRRHWSECSCVTEVVVDTQPDGWRLWRDFELALEKSGKGLFPSDAESINTDAGRYLGFVGMTAKRTGSTPEDLYDPAIGIRFGVDT